MGFTCTVLSNNTAQRGYGSRMKLHALTTRRGAVMKVEWDLGVESVSQHGAEVRVEIIEWDFREQYRLTTRRKTYGCVSRMGFTCTLS